MLAVYFTEAETGDKQVCYLCKKNNQDGYFLHPTNDAELQFLELEFGDSSDWGICDACINEFRKSLATDHKILLRDWTPVP